MSWSWFTLGFCIFLTLAIINSEIFVTLNDKFEDCTKDGPARIVDFSELSFDYVNDTTFFINGNLKFLKQIKSPWKVYIYIEKFERLKWHKAMIDRKISDFCEVAQGSSEPWYRFTSQFSKKNCPYDAGYVETFVEKDFGLMSKLITPTFLGKYRVFFYQYLNDKKEGEIVDCVKIGFEFINF